MTFRSRDIALAATSALEFHFLYNFEKFVGHAGRAKKNKAVSVRVNSLCLDAIRPFRYSTS